MTDDNKQAFDEIVGKFEQKPTSLSQGLVNAFLGALVAGVGIAATLFIAGLLGLSLKFFMWAW